MNAQQQAALAQAQAAKAQQAAKPIPAASSEPTPEQKAQMEAYYKQQQMIQQQIQQQIQVGIQQGLSMYNLDIQGLLMAAQGLEATWKILNVEGNEEEVQKVLNTARVVHGLIDDLVTDRMALRAAQLEAEARSAELQKLAIEAVEKAPADEADKKASEALSEQPQNAPVIITPEVAEAPVA